MRVDDDFEFEVEDDDEDEGRVRKTPSSRPRAPKGPKKKSKPKRKEDPGKKNNVKKGNEKQKGSPVRTARREPVPDGIKRRLAMDLREIRNLKKELKELKDEKESYEHELELLEDEIDSIRSQKEKLQDEVNKHVALSTAYEKKLDRNQKDFDNMRNRVQTDVDRQVKMGQKKIFMGVIDIIDNLDRAIGESKRYDYRPEVSQIIEGVVTIRKSMVKLLAENEVELIDPINEAFDPYFHEAIEVIPDTSVPDGTVIKVETKGYVLKDMVLRAAKVSVSKGGEPRKKISSKKNGEQKEKEKEKEEEEEITDLDEIEEVEDMEELESE
ncbi:MAG: nucleotide exchange factor GrpE [Candidatus Thermoplasmatota archaeon]|nr:nucleotide exchange factor GrpE [Candidatus Thermoplasmatota archaeon]